MTPRLRVVDSGLRGARENLALGWALMEARRRGAAPDTLRFFRFPPSVLIGRHQCLEREVRLDRADGIQLARRLTGGGAVYVDEGQFCWEVVLPADRLGAGSLAEVARSVCGAVADGLRSLGIDAAFRPRNDIEVAGRKLCGTAGFVDGGVLLYQGTVLYRADPARMSAVLNVPAAKLTRHGAPTLAARVVTLDDLLGDSLPPMPQVMAAVAAGIAGLGFDLQAGDLAAEEGRLAREALAEELGRDDWVQGGGGWPGPDSVWAEAWGDDGSIRVDLRLDAGGRVVRAARFSGDFFASPPRLVLDLEAVLAGVPAAAAATLAADFLRRTRPDMLSVGPEQIAALVAAALATREWSDPDGRIGPATVY